MPHYEVMGSFEFGPIGGLTPRRSPGTGGPPIAIGGLRGFQYDSTAQVESLRALRGDGAAEPAIERIVSQATETKE